MKVVLEFTDEERNDAYKAIRVNDIMYALWELQKYRRELYKGYVNGAIVVNGDKVLDEETISKQVKQTYAKELCPEELDSTLPPFKDNKSYIPQSGVLDRIDDILDGVRDLLDD